MLKTIKQLLGVLASKVPPHEAVKTRPVLPVSELLLVLATNLATLRAGKPSSRAPIKHQPNVDIDVLVGVSEETLIASLSRPIRRFPIRTAFELVAVGSSFCHPAGEAADQSSC